MSFDWSQLMRPAVIVVFVSVVGFAGSAIVVPPKDVDAVTDASVTFNCSSSIPGTDIHWIRYPIGGSKEDLYVYGKINPAIANKINVVDGHNLFISSVILNDAGTYECQDDYGRGEKQSAELIILESNPICRSNTNLDKIVGKNVCGIEPGQVTLSCSVQFHGKKAPTLEWKKNGEEKTITSGVSSEIKDNRVLYHLSLKGDLITNGSFYNCRSAKATTNAATCSSSIITIIGDSATAHCDCASSKNYIVAIVCIIVLLLLIFVCLCVFFKRKEKRLKEILRHARIDFKENIATLEEEKITLMADCRLKVQTLTEEQKNQAETQDKRIKEMQKQITELQAHNEQLKESVKDLFKDLFFRGLSDLWFLRMSPVYPISGFFICHRSTRSLVSSHVTEERSPDEIWRLSSGSTALSATS